MHDKPLAASSRRSTLMQHRTGRESPAPVTPRGTIRGHLSLHAATTPTTINTVLIRIRRPGCGHDHPLSRSMIVSRAVVARG